MKAKSPIVLPLLGLVAVQLVIAPFCAASYTEARFTRLEKEVKVLKESAAPHAANLGETINAVTSVATGPDSRAELRFPDQSLTRIGANSRFTVRGEAHTLDLNQGVLYLEVPEKIRSAKVRTAAVTAAVTGGTCFFEISGDIIKIIVVEGDADVYFNINPHKFRTFHSGEMCVMNRNDDHIPAGVFVDIVRLLKYSKLYKMGRGPNYDLIEKALQDLLKQIQNGTLQETTFIIPGPGTRVADSNHKVFSFFKIPQNQLIIPTHHHFAPHGSSGGGKVHNVLPASTPTPTPTVAPDCTKPVCLPKGCAPPSCPPKNCAPPSCPPKNCAPPSCPPKNCAPPSCPPPSCPPKICPPPCFHPGGGSTGD